MADQMREAMEGLVVKIYDSIIRIMDEQKSDTITRSEVMAMKLNFKKRMDYT